MIEIKKFQYSNKSLLKISNEIRTKVFVEEQLVPPDLEYEYEDEGHFYLLYFQNKPIATARWRKTKNGIKLERFASFKEFRNKGLGSKLLKEILSDVLVMEEKIYLHSQINAVNYYKRAGFVEMGDHFFEANIEHVLMEFQKP